jgi:CCR4-NOT transcription complex subunit 6
MFNQGPHQNQQHAMMNGGSAHQRYAMQMSNLTKQYQQHQSHQHQGHQPQHHDQGHGAHGGPLASHQHNLSSGGLSSTTPHFSSSHIQNGASSNVHSSLSRPPNEHWALQLQLAQNAREMTIPHAHARNHPTVNRSVVAGATPGVTKEPGKEERNRPMADRNQTEQQKEVWTSLDLGGQRLKSLSRPLFSYTFLTKLYLNFNHITYLPPVVGQLRNLTHLDLSHNELRELPAEIGMLVYLKEFLLFDNHIETLPFEMGSLYQLEILGIEGNPLTEDLKSVIVDHGTTDLIRYLREHAPSMYPPLHPGLFLLTLFSSATSTCRTTMDFLG